jgi:Holliday junction resolvase RusA-like endonuclease
MKSITLSGEPKSTQHIYKSVCRGKFPTVYLSPEGKSIKQAYQWEAKSQWKGKPIAGEVELSIYFYFKTKHRRDLDNQNKLVLDALNGIVYEDDSQIDALHLYRYFDAKNPRIEITVSALL